MQKEVKIQRTIEVYLPNQSMPTLSLSLPHSFQLLSLPPTTPFLLSLTFLAGNISTLLLREEHVQPLHKRQGIGIRLACSAFEYWVRRERQRQRQRKCVRKKMRCVCEREIESVRERERERVNERVRARERVM